MTTTEAPPLVSVLGELYARAPRGIRLGLDAMSAACTRFGHPERGLAVVHVAGTNGKGSVCAMLESVARSSGLRTGLYTSPHLARFAERIRIGGAPIADEPLRATLSDVLAREPELSFFEAATLAALVSFREAQVDLAILEVGLGGRLDATNVVPSPRACAVTRIALDHTDRLGTTLESIAREKAAIAKPGVPIFLGAMPESILSVLESEATACGGQPIRAIDSAEASAFRQRVQPSLPGEHQRDNAMLAFAIARHLGFEPSTCRRGIESARWPGRLERLDLPGGPVLLDAAHNPDGAASLAAALQGRPASETALVFGALSDKDWSGMLDVLAPLAAVRAYVPPQGRSAADPDLFAQRHPGTVFVQALDAFAHAREKVGPSGLVVVAGSISLVGELRSTLLGEPRDPPVAL